MDNQTESQAPDINESEISAGPADIESLRHRRDELFDEAQKNPSSEAGDILQSLILSGLSTLSRGQSAGGLVPDWIEERRRFRRAEKDRNTRRTASAKSGELESDGARQTPVDSELRLEKVADLTASAEAAAQAGRPMDPQQVYRQIAEIVGLRAPTQQPSIES